jgi:hypothetical protein
MSEGYKKLTKDDIDFPTYCLFFIKKLQETIDDEGLDEFIFTEVSVETTYPYCAEAFELINKTFERKGIEMRTPTYRLAYKHGVKFYTYKWRLRLWSRVNEYSELPF